MSASRQDSFSALLLSDDETPVGTPRKDKNNHPFAGGLGVRSAVLEPATFSVRSQDTYVYSGLRPLQNCLPKPNCRSRCLQLFTWVAVKSLSTTLASNDQPAAFRCGKGSSSRKLISGTEIHWKSGFREAPYSFSSVNRGLSNVYIPLTQPTPTTYRLL